MLFVMKVDRLLLTVFTLVLGSLLLCFYEILVFFFWSNKMQSH
jgi:hypothetical protein